MALEIRSIPVLTGETAERFVREAEENERNPQRRQLVFSFEDIGNAVWGQYIESDRKTIMVTVNRLRKKLNAYPAISNCLETVWSKGYQFIAK